MKTNKSVKNNPEIKKSRRMTGGRAKIAEALRLLLRDREFNAITTARIAETSGMSEALLYRYFGDKRGLLHQVLSDFLKDYLDDLEQELEKVKGTVKKLKKIIRSHFHLFDTNRVLAKILLLEVRNYPGYFESESYGQVRRYSNMIMEVFRQGVSNGDIKKDISLPAFRNAMLGGIEHTCLPKIVFKKSFSPDVMTEELCKILFSGILY
ncbi:MAG: TetR/AcrR family transcriptional regulator [Syntrophobacteraceae bacterium]